MALLVASCSSGGGNHASPTTTIATPSSTAATTTTVSPAHLATNLGPCPKDDPVSLPGRLNVGIKGLGQKLVPIVALNVRVCRYDPRAPSTVLKPPDAMRLEAEANRLLIVKDAIRYNCAPTNPPYFFVTFANDRQQVDVWEDGGCGFITNGVLTVSTTTKWRNELQRYTTSSTAATTATTGRAVGTIREVGGPAPGLNRQIPGTVIATDARGTHWHASTTATRPFSLTLPPGTYRFTGRSALINDGRSPCSEPTPVVVVRGQTTHIEVVCSID
jgi:hypothetical protein